jgi:hypothetical protein
MRTRFFPALSCFSCFLLAVVPEAHADIAFDVHEYPISGLPKNCFVTNSVMLANRQDGHIRAVLLVAYSNCDVSDGKARQAALLVDLGTNGGAVVGTIFDDEFPEDRIVRRVDVVDLEHDGEEELVFLGQIAESHKAYRLEGEAYKEFTLPFPRYYMPAIAWIDYDHDGWKDVFLAGHVGDPNGPEPWKRKAGLLHNEKGQLVPDERFVLQLESGEVIDKAQTLDLNGDQRDDLVLFVITESNTSPGVVRIFTQQNEGLVEIGKPLVGYYQLVGLSEGHAASGDINGDGVWDLLMCGRWNPNLGRRTIISILYRGAKVVNETVEDDKLLFFVDPQSILTLEIPDLIGSWILSDLDRDDDIDAVGIGFTRDTERYGIIGLENKMGVLTPLKNPIHEGSGHVIPLDIDEDGVLDFIIFPSNSDDSPVIVTK